MATRFIGKNLRKKVVRPMKNSVRNSNYLAVKQQKDTEKNGDMAKANEAKPQKENKKQKKNKDMVDNNKLSKMEAIVSTNAKETADASKTNVKVEKAEKGLFEKTEESTVLLTEDNKMLLTD